MRIAYLCNRYPAVSHSFVRREIAGMEAAGHQVDRYTIREPGPVVDGRDEAERRRTTPVLAAGVLAIGGALAGAFVRSPRRFVDALRLALRGTTSPGSLVRHLAYLGEAAWLVQRFRRHPVDHLHVHFGTNPTTVARLVRRLGGPPYSFTAHGPDEFDRPVALDLRGKVAEAARAVAISSFGASQLMRWSDPRDWHRITVARCGVDDDFLSAPLTPPASAPRFVSVARLSGQKGLPLLIEAAALLAARGRDFTLDIAGDGELRADLERAIADAGLAGRVRLIGTLDGAGVRSLIEGARAFVLPSFAEGLPVVLMEALALGRPVIATAIAGTSELVDAGCGWLIPAGSAAAVADAMAAAIDLPDKAIAALGAEGRRRVAARHDAKANAAGLAELIGGEARPC